MQFEATTQMQFGCAPNIPISTLQKTKIAEGASQVSYAVA